MKNFNINKLLAKIGFRKRKKKISIYIAIMASVIFIGFSYNAVGSHKTKSFSYVEKHVSKKEKTIIKYGVINSSGKEIVPPIYDNIYDFYCGYAIVINNDNLGVIDSNGVLIVPPKCSRIGNFRGSLIPVQIDDKWGFIDKNGKQVTELKYNDFKNAEEGFYLVSLNNKWGVINSAGKEITDIKYDRYDFGEINFNEGRMRVYFDGKWGYINSDGKEITKIKYNEADDFKDGKAHVAQIDFNSKHGLIDKNGKEVVPLVYDELERVSNGFSYVGKYNKEGRNLQYGVINEKNNKLITRIKYFWICREPGFSFSKKVAKVFQIQNYNCGLIDENGKKIIPINYGKIDALRDMYVVYHNDKYGYANEKGKFILPIENDNLGNDDLYNKIEGIYAQQSLLLLLCKNNKYGFANREGKIVTPIKYDNIERLHSGGALVSIHDKVGYVNEIGKETIPVKFDIPLSESYKYFQDGILIYKQRNKWGAIDSTGVVIAHQKYDSITDFSQGFSIGYVNKSSFIIDKKGSSKLLNYDEIIKCETKAILVSKSGKWGVLNINNQLITPLKYNAIRDFKEGYAIVEMKFNK